MIIAHLHVLSPAIRIHFGSFDTTFGTHLWTNVRFCVLMSEINNNTTLHTIVQVECTTDRTEQNHGLDAASLRSRSTHTHRHRMNDVPTRIRRVPHALTLTTPTSRAWITLCEIRPQQQQRPNEIHKKKKTNRNTNATAIAVTVAQPWW